MMPVWLSALQIGFTLSKHSDHDLALWLRYLRRLPYLSLRSRVTLRPVAVQLIGNNLAAMQRVIEDAGIKLMFRLTVQPKESRLSPNR